MADSAGREWGEMKWFTADNHFFHKNVIEYCNRPFASLEEMHAEMIRRWNVVVSENDEVYILGDFCFGGVEKWKSILAQLKGRKFLVKGNHDTKQVKPERASEFGLEWVKPTWVIPDKPIGDVVLSHFPYKGQGDHTEGEERYADRREVNRGCWLFHGHVHQHWKIKGMQINVGVDQWAYAPVSWDELVLLAQNTTKPAEKA